MAATRTRFTAPKLFVGIVLLAAVGSMLAWYYPKRQSREYLQTAKEDLRNLAAAQEAYASDNGGAFMPPNPRVTTTMQFNGYAPSSEVTVSIAESGPGSWSATARHNAVPGAVCGIFIGDPPSAGQNPAAIPGEPKCQ